MNNLRSILQISTLHASHLKCLHSKELIILSAEFSNRKNKL